MDTIATLDVLGNSLLAWGAAAFCVPALYAGLLLSRRLVATQVGHWLPARLSMIGRAIAGAARSTHHLFIMALVLGLAGYLLALPPGVERLLFALVLVAVMVQAGLWTTAFANVCIDHYVASRSTAAPEYANATHIVKFLALATIWSVVLLLTLSNFGINISGLIAGLGIGGIAIAFALQSILKDLFASLTIVLDKPFVVGDFIIFGEQLGTVEQIGLKTTRVRSLWGEQISVANDDLLSRHVRNYKRMQERRVSFNIMTTFETPVDKLEAIPVFIRRLISSMDHCRFDRSHLAAFEEAGPRIETVFYVLSPDYNMYMDIQQEINLRIARHFATEGIEFAYPTRRVIDAAAPRERRVPVAEKVGP
jgi:small-conductance mechanosensitive channel